MAGSSNDGTELFVKFSYVGDTNLEKVTGTF